MKKDTKVLITIPVYNEEMVLEKSVRKLLIYCLENIHLNFKILIADNASVDKTRKIGRKLSKSNNNIDYFRLNEKGRGKVLFYAWERFKSDCYVYMDVDLSTDIKHLKTLIEAVSAKGFDVAIGTRNAKQSKVKRKFLRTFISKGYIFLLKSVFGTKLSDTQCGFKAFSCKAVENIWKKLDPQLWEGSAWFFDTEALLIAEKKGFKIKEVPVSWKGSEYSKVSLFRDIKEDLNGIKRLIKTKPWKT